MTTTASVVFHTLHGSGGMSEGTAELYRDNGNWPLRYCRRHRHYAQGNDTQQVAYCPWMDTVVGPKLLAVELAYTERKRESRTMGLRQSALDKILGRKPTALNTILGT